MTATRHHYRPSFKVRLTFRFRQLMGLYRLPFRRRSILTGYVLLAGWNTADLMAELNTIAKEIGA